MTANPFGPDRTFLVTGASRGIGAALAEQVATPGAKIALFARTKDALEQVATRVRALGAEALVLAGDAGDLAAVHGAHGELAAKWGRVDVAFLNAGAGEFMRISKFDAEVYRRIFAVNVFGITHWLHCLLPAMIEARRGTIVGVSSLASLRGAPNAGPYSASKAAASNLLESVRLEARRFGITVCTVEPGFVRTDMTASNKFPMPFLMEPAEAARIICARASRGHSLIRLPWQYTAAMKLVSWLPNWIYDRVSARALLPDRTLSGR